MGMMETAMSIGNPKTMANWGDKQRKKYQKKSGDIYETGVKQHKCFYGGGDQGILSLRACPEGARSGGLVTRGSAKEKSRLSGKFKIV